MAEGSEQNPSGIIRQSGNFEQIQSSEQSNLGAIDENLTERIKQAKTPEEILEYLKLKDYVQNQALRQLEQETAKIRLQEAKAQVNFNRRLAIAREVRTLVAGTVTVAIGLYLIGNSPVFGALLITLGLAKPLEYSLGEISEFLKNLSELIRQFPNLFLDNRREPKQTDESSMEESDKNESEK